MSSEDRNTSQTREPGKGIGIFSAADLGRHMAEREMAKAAEELRHMREREEKQKALMEEFHKPPARTPDQLMELVTLAVDRVPSLRIRGSHARERLLNRQIDCRNHAYEQGIDMPEVIDWRRPL